MSTLGYIKAERKTVEVQCLYSSRVSGVASGGTKMSRRFGEDNEVNEGMLPVITDKNEVEFTESRFVLISS